MLVLVDTSVWIEFLDRFNPAVRDELATLLRTNRVATAGIVLAELRQGCRSPAQVKTVLEMMEPLAYCEVNWGTWLHAGQLVAEGSSRGMSLDLGDCLLAALAMREDYSVFTLDRDFQRISGLKLYGPRVN
ncbi:MAG: PIN domain-containing protein [Terriglobia bacterium]